MSPDEARSRFATERVARLATADASGRPHLVPFVFAVSGDTIYSAVDHKAKRTQSLRRLADIEENQAVSALADAYDDSDWSRLWWARADGSATVHEPGSPAWRTGVALLAERYEQYVDRPIGGPVISIAVDRWSGWEADAS